MINEVEYTISNTRTVSVTNLAKTYAGMEGIREDHKELIYIRDFLWMVLNIIDY